MPGGSVWANSEDWWKTQVVSFFFDHARICVLFWCQFRSQCALAFGRKGKIWWFLGHCCRKGTGIFCLWIVALMCIKNYIWCWSLILNLHCRCGSCDRGTDTNPTSALLHLHLLIHSHTTPTVPLSHNIIFIVFFVPWTPLYYLPLFTVVYIWSCKSSPAKLSHLSAYLLRFYL